MFKVKTCKWLFSFLLIFALVAGGPFPVLTGKNQVDSERKTRESEGKEKD